jgi:hypothetical protein
MLAARRATGWANGVMKAVRNEGATVADVGNEPGFCGKFSNGRSGRAGSDVLTTPQ